jgi:ABC-type phosphate transport system substrate-binding protein
VTRRTWRAPLALAASLALLAIGGTGSALAGNPGGTPCATDGRIAGSGDTFGATLHTRVLIPFYCSGDQVVYDYTGAPTQWEDGVISDSCRSDMFSSSGFPYDEGQLRLLRTRPGSVSPCPTASRSPFPPNTAPFPARTDVAASPLTVPIAATTIALPYNLPASCTATGALQLTGKMVSALFGGVIRSWDDRRLRKGGVNPSLATCKVPVLRVVRSDDAGATAVMKDYLAKVDPLLALPSPPAGAPGFFTPFAGDCNWPCYNTKTTNRNWPGGDGAFGAEGDGSVAVAVQEHVGAIGYVEVAPVAGMSLQFANVKSIRGKTFQPPTVASPNGVGANADLSKALLPSSPLGTGDQTWANQPDGSGFDDVVGGSKYPIQGLVTVLALPLATTPKAISRSTLDQRQTLLDYLQYALSAPVQTRIGNAGYAALPAAWVRSISAALAAQY